MKRVSIVVNKNWEAEPMLAGLCSKEFRPANLPFPVALLALKDSKYRVNPDYQINSDENTRAIFKLFKDNDPQHEQLLEARVWCIQDFMDLAKSSSSSEEKNRFLPELLGGENPDLVIAVGTAGYPSDTSYAGCVLIGSRFFIHNGNENNPASRMSSPYFDSVLAQNINSRLFSLFDSSFKLKTEPKFLKTPNNPAGRSACLASQHYTAISSVNVTDYSEYVWVDGESIEAFKSRESKLPIGSLETTHGVIRLCTDQPTIFISAITDREGHFDLEVTPGQNYTASFNAGIVLGQLLVDMSLLLANEPKFDFAKH